MAEEKLQQQGSPAADDSAAERLLVVLGLGLLVSAALATLCWVPVEFSDANVSAHRDVVLLAASVGIAAGYALFHLLAQRESFCPFSAALIVAASGFACLLPLAVVLMVLGLTLPSELACVAGFLSGVGLAYCVACWLEAAVRLFGASAGVVMATGLVVAGVLFALEGLLTAFPRSLVALATVVAAASFQLVVGARAAAHGVACAQVDAPSAQGSFALEIWPAKLGFGIVFALTFAFLINCSEPKPYGGMLAVLPGALCALAAMRVRPWVDVVIMQRAMVLITVVACVAMPFAPGGVQVAAAGVMVAVWAAYTAMNWLAIMQRCALDGEVFCRVAGARLLPSAVGLALGWAVFVVANAAFGPHSGIYLYIRLCVAVALVFVVMVFFPSSSHHATPASGFGGQSGASTPDAAAGAKAPRAEVVAKAASDAEDVERRALEVMAQRYRLSPRERDVFYLLARGRNADYIHDKLGMAHSTAKTHTTNIYRKFDVHSRQELMDLVDAYRAEDK